MDSQLILSLLAYVAMGVPYFWPTLRGRYPGMTWRNVWHPTGLNLIAVVVVTWPFWAVMFYAGKLFTWKADRSGR